MRTNTPTLFLACLLIAPLGACGGGGAASDVTTAPDVVTQPDATSPDGTTPDGTTPPDATSPDAKGPDVAPDSGGPANHAPSIGEVLVLPAKARAGDALSCVWQGFSDPDGDADASTWVWKINGVEVGSGQQLTAGFVGSDTVSCEVTPHDGQDAGAPRTGSILIMNTPPQAADAIITPAVPRFGDTVRCAPEAYSDVDGDEDVSQFEWTLDGVVVGSGSEFSGLLSGGAVLGCTVTPHDGQDAGTPRTATVVVGNSAPSLTGARIEPQVPHRGATVTCAAEGFSDPDGDADASTFMWEVNGALAATGPELEAAYKRGDQVRCTVTPDDGEDAGTPATALALVGNAPPGVDLLAITPAAPVGGEALSCSWGEFTDLDGDPDLSTVTWSLNGQTAGIGKTFGGVPAAGDVVTCAVTPFDGFAQGAISTHVVTVGNAPPTVDSVTISPAAPRADDVLTCAWEGFSDADGDSDDSTVRWLVNGKLVAFGTQLAGAFSAGDEVTCRVQPWDGHSQGAVVSDTVVIENSLPNVSGVVIAPLEPVVGDTLSCSWQSFNDPDGDEDHSTVVWLVNGEPIGQGAELGAAYSDGDEVSCVVTAHDGLEAGLVSTVKVTVGNSAPSITSAVVQPKPAVAADTLSCQGHGFSDADGDSDSSLVTWRINGVVVGDDPTLAGGFSAGDIVSCEVTPYDGKTSGMPFAAKIIIANTPPSIEAALLSPSTPRAGDSLACSWKTFSDPDAQGDLSKVEWRINGVSVGQGKTWQGGFVAGDTVSCVVTPHDGVDAGQPVMASVEVANTPPVLGGAAVTPATPRAGDVLTCAGTGFQDADGHDDLSTYLWTIDGAPAGTGATLAAVLSFGQEVACTATPFDGIDQGVAVTTTATVSNSPPSALNAAIAPETPRVTDSLTCVVEGFHDADGHANQSSFSWKVNGVPAGQGPVLSEGFAFDDEVECAALPFDGLTAGEVVTAQVQVENSPPSITKVSISPVEPTTADTLTCSWSGFADADGHPDSSTVAWLVNGELRAQGPTLSTALMADDLVVCTVTPHDGHDAGAAKSADVTAKPAPASMTSVTVTPASPKVTDTLTCMGEATSEEPGAEIELAYQWRVNDAVVGSGSTLSGAFARGNVVSCTVTPLVGPTVGTPMSKSVTVVNSLPQVTSVTLSPEAPTTNDTVTASASGTDPDGDAVSFTYKWFVDGSPVAGSGPTLDGAVAFDRDQTITVEVTAADPFDLGTSKVSDAVVVRNSAPTAPTVEISPTEVSAPSADLVCSIINPPSDPDGDGLTTTFAWTKDGVPTTHTGATVPTKDHKRGESWTCAATVADDTLSASSAAASTLVATAVAANVWVEETWDTLGSPYVLTSDIAVGTDGMLDIKAGVEVYGRGHTIQVRGTLKAGSDTGAMTLIEDLHIAAPVGGSAFEYVIQFARVHYIGGTLHPEGQNDAAIQLGFMTVKKCVFEGLEAAIAVVEAPDRSEFLENLFLWSHGLWLDPGEGNRIDVKMNTFYEWEGGFAIAKWSGQTGDATIQGNGFLSTDRVAVMLPVGATGGLKARDNWWGTTTPSVIATMVFDLDDHAGSPDLVDWGNWLDIPDDKAPTLDGWVP